MTDLVEQSLVPKELPFRRVLDPSPPHPFPQLGREVGHDRSQRDDRRRQPALVLRLVGLHVPVAAPQVAKQALDPGDHNREVLGVLIRVIDALDEKETFVFI